MILQTPWIKSLQKPCDNNSPAQLLLLQFQCPPTLEWAETGTRGKSLICHLPGNGRVLTVSILVLRTAVVSQVFQHMLLTENSLQICCDDSNAKSKQEEEDKKIKKVQ